ncbi:hypothetical protein D8S78_15445 [Natrialba swarupiae]|nr:hypothetical protein [Natrialba swarupiae]
MAPAVDACLRRPRSRSSCITATRPPKGHRLPNTGSWLIFGVVLVPIYVMVTAWFVGTPRDTKPARVTYLVGLTTTMWVSMLVMTLVIGLVFFGRLPEPIGSPGL